MKRDDDAPEAVELPIDGTLDLHTFQPREVKDLVPHYLAECRARGILEVRIIHGKGKGVLRDTVHSLLTRIPGVDGFMLAGDQRGAWGATIVTLLPRQAGPGERGVGRSASGERCSSGERMKDRGELDWPEGLHPDETPVYTRNEIQIPADPEHVWAWLIRAELWPTWYANCRNVKFLSGTAPDLAAGTVFAWTTFGVRVKTTIREFAPPARLAWTGEAPGGRAYHGWLIEKTGEACRVVTEETQRGVIPSLGRYFLKRRLEREHQKWLEGLARMVQRGLPPGPET